MDQRRTGVLARLLLPLVVAASSSAPVLAQFAEPLDPDPAAVAAFEKLLEAYRTRPALGVRSTLSIALLQGDLVSDEQKITAEFTTSRTAAGAGPDQAAGRAVIRDFTCVFGAGSFDAVHAAKPDAYYHEDYEGSPYWPLLINFKDIPYPHLAILWGEADPREVWMQLHPESPMIVPTAVGEIERKGKTLQRLVLSSPQAIMRVEIDPKTRLIHAIEHSITGGHAVQPGTTKVTTYTFEYTEYDEPLPKEKLAFDPGERRREGMLAALLPPRPERPGPGAALTGKPAPPFVLETLDGGAVDLEELAGKVVVLDFWATWCAPCRKALPLLHEVAAWARHEALPVEIIAVNVWENRGGGEDTPDARRRTVRAFWEQNGYTIRVAMDYTDETGVAYGVRGIPATFVIRSDGVVHAQPHADVEGLKESIREAIKALETAP